jgi:hypothetical protein
MPNSGAKRLNRRVKGLTKTAQIITRQRHKMRENTQKHSKEQVHTKQ